MTTRYILTICAALAMGGVLTAGSAALSEADERTPVPTPRTGADDNRIAADRMVPCADQKGDMTSSADCASPTRGSAFDSSSGAMAACPSRTDATGKVIYDDPNCPARYRKSHEKMGSSFENVVLTKESAFFDRHIGNAVKHARAAEIAGNMGHAPDMLQHAQQSLDLAKEAQLAGNVPGLNEGINSLRKALTLTLTADRTASGDNRAAADRMAPCADLRGDAVAFADCEARNRRMGDDRTGFDRTAYDSSAETIAACPSRTDARGNVIYDDPNCPARYPHPQGISLQDATNHVREARIRLSEAGGMRSTDTRPSGALTTRTNPAAKGDR